jgi:SAM-dependent methyltransferase
MRLAFALALAACTSAAPPPVKCPSPPPCAQCAPLPPEPVPPTEAWIKQRSYDVLVAFDKADHASADGMLARDFVHFEGGWSESREKAVDALKKRKPGAPFIAKRTFEEEKVFIHPTAVLFTGKATETQGGNDAKGGYKYVGWYTLQWVPEGTAWKLRYWTWQRAGEHAQRDTWNDIYKNDVGFSKKPNQLLVDTIKGKKPGTALDLTMGQGRNALYLASQGWKTTGVDIADGGLRIAREEAAKRKLAVTMIEANIDTWDFGTNKWDLVTMIYAGPNQAKWAPKIKASLKKGGLFVLEYFAYDPDKGQDDGIKPGELAKLYEDFEIVRDDVVDDAPDWAVDRAKLQRFVARRK